MPRMLRLLVAAAFISALSPAVAAEPKELRTLKGTGVAWVAFSPDGKTLAATSPDEGQVKLWDVKTGELATLKAVVQRGGLICTFSPDGKTLALRGDKGVILVDVESRKELATLKVETVALARFGGTIAGLGAFSPDGKTLAMRGDKGVILVDVESRKERFVLNVDGMVGFIAFRPKTSILVTQTRGGQNGVEETWKFWDIETGKEQAAFKTSRVPVMAFSSDGKHLALGHPGGRVTAWDAETQKQVASQDAIGWGTGSVQSITFSPDSTKIIYYAGHGGVVRRTMGVIHWDFAKSKFDNNMSTAARVTKLSFSPDGCWLAMTKTEESNQVLELNRSPELEPVAIKGVRFFAFSPDSKNLATVSEGKITLWELDPAK